MTRSIPKGHRLVENCRVIAVNPAENPRASRSCLAFSTRLADATPCCSCYAPARWVERGLSARQVVHRHQHSKHKVGIAYFARAPVEGSSSARRVPNDGKGQRPPLGPTGGTGPGPKPAGAGLGKRKNGGKWRFFGHGSSPGNSLHG